MGTFKRILLMLCVIYSLFMAATLGLTQHKAKSESLNLKKFNAEVIDFRPCGGRSAPSCRIAIVQYQNSEKSYEAKLRGTAENLKIGDKLPIWTQLGWRHAYYNPSEYVRLSIRFWPLLLLPVLLLLLPLVFATQEAQRELKNSA